MNDINEGQARFVSAILDGTPAMLAYWDRDLICRFANQAYETWFGVPGHSLTGTSLRDLLGPELFARNELHICAALRGQAQEFERLVPGPSSVMRPSLAVYVPHVVDGQVLGFIAQVTDVTRLHRAKALLDQKVQEASHANLLLRKAHRELKLAQRLGEMGSWCLEVDEDIVSWSTQLYVLFGLDESRLPPAFADHHALFTPSSFAVVQTAVQRTIDFGQPYCIEVEYVHQTGRLGWMELRGTAERDPTGRVTRLHGTALEITARRVARDAFKQIERISELEARLAGEQLKNARLEQSALEASRLGAIGLIASGIAHDFNNVLATLSGSMNLLRRTSREERTSRLAEQGIEAIKRAASLTRRLMNVARPPESRPRVVSLAASISAGQEVLTLAAGPLNRIEFDLSLEAEAVLDPHELEIALLNLVINARDAMEQPGVVRIGLEKVDNPSGATEQAQSRWVAVTVTDSGKGMDADTLRRAREPFFSTKSPEQGTGLGLAMVSTFAVASGGILLLESTVGAGTCVRVVVPVSDVDALNRGR